MPPTDSADTGFTVHAEFRCTSWEEANLGATDAQPKLTRASCTQEYTGEIAARSTLEYLMAYCDGGTASFVGMERIEGTVAGRRGSFAMRHEGLFENGVARMTLQVVEGSGTAELAGLRGSAQFESAHAESYAIELECTLPT